MPATIERRFERLLAARLRAAAAVLRVVVRRSLQDHGFLLASGISFSFLLCLAPLVLALFSVAGFLLESDEVAEFFYDTARLLFPAYEGESARFLGLLIAERKANGILGGLGLVVFATQLFGLVRTVMNRAFRVPQARRFIHGLVFDLFAITVVGSLVVSGAIAIAFLLTLAQLAVRVLPLPVPPVISLKRTFSLPLIYSLGLALLFFVYRKFPNTAVSSRNAAVATVFVGTLWELARRGFTAYVKTFGGYGRLYGSFGIGVAALVWVYYSSIIFVLGAELSAIRGEARARAAVGGADASAPITR